MSSKADTVAFANPPFFWDTLYILPMQCTKQFHVAINYLRCIATNPSLTLSLALLNTSLLVRLCYLTMN